MVKILVVDDHDMVRMGLMRMLADVDGFEVIGEAKNGEEALSMARALRPNVILMDVKMPGIGGLEATRRIIAGDPEVKIIAVTAISDDIFPERFMSVGASGYVSKGAHFDEMVKAIKSVCAGRPYMSASVAQQLALRTCSRSKTGSPFEGLSERELQTAIMVANGAKVQSIADSLSISTKTVNSYRYRIFEKLGVTSDVELTILALKHKVLDIDDVN
ncbi:MAG TPA: response regulator [Cellvibrionaceae bacterium]|nr:response regulator [Cellvibrionaceae bacterium]HMW48202.1 response regulator [Cellvibrionaceae bacterium]HMW71480.1 response regulator [Cellvibrionaceae bacterium]HMY38330.1 response regulator [Marinagarivorans sp.]HNG60151.1 response regulator [Cellvibrionaceae bacterium]